MNLDFTAIDFETALGARNSICQIGLVRVENGVTVKEIDLLVQPPGNAYWPRFTQIHGISAADTFRSPFFDEVWPQVQAYIEGQRVVAHNSAFDFGCLRSTLSYYGLEVPSFEGFCTYKIYRLGLAALAAQYALPLSHHEALSDARACAQLFLMHLQKSNT